MRGEYGTKPRLLPGEHIPAAIIGAAARSRCAPSIRWPGLWSAGRNTSGGSLMRRTAWKSSRAWGYGDRSPGTRCGWETAICSTAFPDPLERQARAWEQQGHTVAFYGCDGEVSGALAFGDRIKAGAADLIAGL